MSNSAEVLQAGLAHHEAGRLQEAEQHYRQVLGLEPRNADALHLLGVLALQCGHAQVAVEYISAAIRCNGNQAAYHANLAAALGALSQFDDARRAYEKVIELAPWNAAAHNNLGTIHEAQGNLPAAIACYRRAIKEHADYPDAHNNLGIALDRQGDSLAAAECLRRAVTIAPRYARGHYNLGVNLAQRGMREEAVQALAQAVSVAPDYAEAHYALAMTLQQLGQAEQARPAYERALSLRPNWAEAASSFGSLLQSMGALDEAGEMYQRALAANPHFAEAIYNQGTLFKLRGNLEAALASYQRAVAAKPNFPEAHFNLGTLLQRARMLPEARDAYQEAIRWRPNYAAAHNNLGNVLRELRELDAAIECYDKSLEFDPQNAQTLINLGSAWHERGSLEKALACYDQAMQFNSASSEVYNNLGTALRDMDREAEALAAFERSIELDPNVAEPHYNRGLMLLARERFAEGWPEFAWRQSCKNYPRREFSQPQWQGEPLRGGTLLVHAEQGFGDSIQFVRLLSQVRERAGRVVLEVQPQLVPLLAQSGFVEALPGRGDTPPADAHVPLLDLAAIFVQSTADVSGEPYLKADAARFEKWRKRLEEVPGFKVGIAWQGNRDYVTDRWRSIPLAQFAPLAKITGVSVVSLQKGYGAEQLAEFREAWPVLDLAMELDNEGGAFLDTAAAMQSLDLVVTSDTSIAHLAGALGVPVWVALPLVPDWRWFRERADSPWYASMRLFRQHTAGDWNDVFARIAAALAVQIAEQIGK